MTMLAYLDAGSLGLIFTAIAGGAAGVAMLLRMYGNKFLGLFSKSRRERARQVEAELRGTTEQDEAEQDEAAEADTDQDSTAAADR